ncbi:MULTISPECIES: type VI secretion protein [Pseudomonas]|jgi:type VI secretion system protein|uniref:type VI secretion protein n=1 Tax=Pseudomonas TaxID=286 RepID=UPI000BA45DB2|nr:MULTISPECIES: type VI secretion protein [Pseudomonas]MCU1725200.1 type VI secretion protein [Pseudomonas sp. 5P_5.1_Bac1]MCU1735438.1 type VI secretion protein [Pseudomonas sp. 20P_3.2_Bac4]MCU1745380.1 type VI secretion protein [Pseudomonas sp. 20P_3.2_Bac5]
MRLKKFISIKILAVLLTASAMAGCSLFGSKVSVDGVTLDVALRANDDSPIAVDFVAANDVDLLGKLSGLTAKQWFATREQYQRDFRQYLHVWGMELVPGQLIESSTFPLDGKPSVGLLVFANYQSPGAHRLRLEDQRSIRLKFDSREMTLLDQNTR